MTTAIDAVVLGASGYVGGELLRLIAAHPTFRLAAAVSESRAGTPVSGLFPSLSHCYAERTFTAIASAVDEIADGGSLALFAAAPHGVSALAVARVLDAASRKSLEAHAVDASADFRYASAEAFESVYGLPHPAPELLPQFECAVPEHLLETRAPHVGHPGCFATAVLLAAVPLLAADLVDAELYVTGITGSTGSGRTPQAGTHHPERHGNVYAYKALRHRHAPEIEALINKATDRAARVCFVPHSGPFARGIYVTLQARLKAPLDDSELRDAVRRYYRGSEFVHVVDSAPRLKDVVASNHCHLGAATNGANVVVMAAIDNLVKGAAGGAMQWMNRLWSLPETRGLTAAPPAWT